PPSIATSRGERSRSRNARYARRSVINIDRVTRSFGARALLRDASLRIGARDRVALVGPNGSGKTTLLEMVMGLQAPDDGRIDVNRDVVIGYLPQETDALRGRDILTEVMSAAPAMP